MNSFEALLHTNNLRVTKPRRQIFQILSRSTDPLSLSDICKKTKGIDRASVYRTVSTFKKIGVAEVVYIGWKQLYELTDLFKPHHHHLRCTSCLNIFPVTDAGFEEAIESLAANHGFRITSHTFEIDGVCEECQQKPYNK